MCHTYSLSSGWFDEDEVYKKKEGSQQQYLISSLQSASSPPQYDYAGNFYTFHHLSLHSSNITIALKICSNVFPCCLWSVYSVTKWAQLLWTCKFIFICLSREGVPNPMVSRYYLTMSIYCNIYFKSTPSFKNIIMQ